MTGEEDITMRKIKWGVLGTAGIAQSQTIPGMLEAENCELYAVAGRSLEKAEVFKAEFGFEKAYGSYQEMLDDPQVEAVYIPLPNELHMEWTIRTLEAKKHVLCEKPIAPSAVEAQKMFDAAKANGVLLMEAFAYLHSPYVSMLKQEIDQGTIGDVVYLESAFVTGTYDVSNIRMRRETFGGAMYDLGCYNVSLALWLMGKEPDEVQATALYSPLGVDDYSSALLLFDGGVRAALESGMVLPKGGDVQRLDRVRIYGTKGYIKSETQFNEAGEVGYTICANGETIEKKLFAPQNYKLEVEQLGRCILDGEAPHVSEEFTMMNARTLDRILEKMGY